MTKTRRGKIFQGGYSLTRWTGYVTRKNMFYKVYQVQCIGNPCQKDIVPWCLQFSSPLTLQFSHYDWWLRNSLSSSRFKVNVQFLSRWIAGSRLVGRLVSDDYITRRTHLSLDQWIPLTEPQSLIHWPADKIVTIVSNKILKSLNVIY